MLKRRWKSLLVGLVVVVSAAVLAGSWWLSGMAEAEFWAPAIAAFEERDRAEPPLPGTVVFTGSSSIRMWKMLAEDMHPLPVLNRGFGGSHLAHVNHYADRIVLPYAPRAVVLYAGDNDLAGNTGKTPESVLDDFREFVSLVHAKYPKAPVYFLAIKPSLRRIEQWPVMQRANELIGGFAGRTPRVEYLDIATPMLDADEKPRGELFLADGLHLNEVGYALWTSIVHPVLARDWPQLAP